MTEFTPSKYDIENILKKLRALSNNKVCFDCNAKNPTWSSVTYGVFICLDCSAVHRSLGVHLTFVKSTQLDTNWSWIQLRNMQVGGNVNANQFFHQHNCSSQDAQQKYNSRAAQLYKEKIHKLALQAMKLYGTNIGIGIATESSIVDEKKELDFFEENHPILSPSLVDHFEQQTANGNLSNGTTNEDCIGPNVEHALKCNSTEAPPQIKKSNIGQRRPASKLGAKKGGVLGAQRVKKDFASIEQEVARKEQLREDLKTVQPTKEEQETSLNNLQKAYETMGLANKKEEAKMKKIDPKKAEQAERLGMGFGTRSMVSHSMFGEMTTIEQDKPQAKESSHRAQNIEDEFDRIIRFSTGPPKYNDSPFDSRGSFVGFPSKGSGIEDLLKENKPAASSDWENDFEKVEMPTAAAPKEKGVSVSANYPFKPVDDVQAQQKFGNAKSISSDMFFSDKDPDYEMRSNLSRFEGSLAISSNDFFGEPQGSSRRQQAYKQAPDLDEVRESVRQGVTKVAGRLSNLATNVMSTIQDRYA